MRGDYLTPETRWGSRSTQAGASSPSCCRLLNGWVLLLLALSACLPNPTQRCETNEHCPGELACLSGICQPRACIVSQDCPIGHFCQQTTGQCLAGCEQETDCAYGSTCSGGTCVSSPCRSTELDCGFGEYCDAVTGTCFQAAGPYCKPCDAETDCGGDEARCVYVSGEGPWCAPACDTDRPCPQGYSCVPFTSNGSIIGYNCVTLCQNISSTTRRTGARP